jgi:phage terminase Nu1 subunit (DNA packaging protein)
MSGFDDISRAIGRLEAQIGEMSATLGRVETELTADKADLAALKNRGVGFLIGIGMLGAVVGAKIGAMVAAVKEVFQ